MSPKTKRFFSALWHATMLGTTIATAALLLFFTVMKIEAATSGKTEPGMNFASLLTIVGFSLVVAYARELFRVRSLPSPALWALNFLIIGIAYFIVILRSRQFAFTSAASYVVGIVIYILVYGAIAGGAALIRFLLKKRKKPEAPTVKKEEYTSRFS
ncbi:MAG: hypothetical protein IJF73_05615 [Clostridia bacterium]|nr:hypothetical protein [Clostridia bacterium]